MADEMTVIDASGLASIDYAQYLTDYFSTIGTATGQTTYYDGPNSGPGLGYISGTQFGVRYNSTTNDRQVLMEGTDIQYDGIDGIHHGTYSGDVDSVTFGAYDAGTTYTQTETARGELTGVIPGLVISNLDISTDIGTPTGPGNAIKTLMDTLKNAGITVDGAQANILKLYEIFGARAQHFIGSDGNDNYVGTAFDDLIDGGLGNDTMTGGLGNDTYVVDSRLDVTAEAVDGGIDTIQTAISHFLIRENIENLVQLGTEDMFSYGNDLGNTITGNSGNSTLIGQGGADTLIGGLGDDTYYLDAEDTIVELDGEGKDTVVTDLDGYALADVLEDLTLAGSGDDEIPDSDLNGSGNALDNTLIGNGGKNQLFGLGGADALYAGAGNDLLDGGAGSDAMSGGEGNDAYVVDSKMDTITEFDGEGKDTVRASVSFTLADFVEKLRLTGSANLNGTGNSGDNVLVGNTGANKLWGLDGADLIKGGQGADQIHGGLGIDSLFGGAGADTFFFFRAGETSANKKAADTINDFRGGLGDLINLHSIDADSSTKGNQDFDFIGKAAFSGEAGELRFEKTASDTYISGDTNGDGNADFTIHLDGAFNVKEDFFVL